MKKKNQQDLQVKTLQSFTFKKDLLVFFFKKKDRVDTELSRQKYCVILLKMYIKKYVPI